MQRMNPNRIKLLVTLVLFVLAATSSWMTSQADARGLWRPDASSHSVATRPDVDLASGDPDAGQGVLPPPPVVSPTKMTESGAWSGLRPSEWVRWTSRIWKTLFPRAAR